MKKKKKAAARQRSPRAKSVAPAAPIDHRSACPLGGGHAPQKAGEGCPECDRLDAIDSGEVEADPRPSSGQVRKLRSEAARANDSLLAGLARDDAGEDLQRCRDLHVRGLGSFAREPRPAAVGDTLIVRRPVDPHGRWSFEALESFRAKVTTIFEDGAHILDTTDGAYLLYDLRGYTHEDGAMVTEHPATTCERLGGCVRNPVDSCIRCGVLS